MGPSNRSNPGAPQPHTLRTTGTTDSAGTRTATYTYDLLGNTKTRPSSAGTQTLDWDVEGHLSTSTDNTGPTQYVYDADGNRLIRRDPTGSTLYLPDQELRHTKTTGTKTATRYYHHAGHPIATRTPSGLRWLATDHQGTPLTTVHSNSQAVAQRRQTPYGTVRTTIGAWPSTMDKGFVGGTIDNTGLTHLGAREYDPFIGRFLSVDPVIDREDPQQLHGYSYSNGNPVTMSDPDGRLPGWMKKIGSVVQQQAQAHVDMAKKAASVVNSAATAAASKAWSGIKATGTLLYERSGEFSALLGVIALFTPPPANAIVAGGSLAFGAVNAYQKCSKQKWVDCGLAVAGMVPGFGVVRAGAGVAKARSVIQAGNAALGAADDGIRLARAGANNALPAGHHRGIRPSATSKR